MRTTNPVWRPAVLACGLVVAAASPGWAAPGDIHRIANAELVNLRAGPSEQSNVRGRVNQGDEVIELTRRGGWLGVRVLDTGEEGWIFGDLLEPVARSTLGGEGAGGDAGFLQLSETFDVLLRQINDDLGYPVVERTRQTGEGALSVTPSREWLLGGSRDAHIMAATAIYQMWKNHQDGRPVSVAMLDDQDREYITIRDRDSGPELRVAVPQP